jgi:hypothetical protein
MYTLSAPKFCGGCGSELSESDVAKASKPKRVPLERESIEDFDPDGLDIFKVPKITKLSYSVEMDPSTKIKLSDLIPLEELDGSEFDKGQQPKKRSSSKKPANGSNEKTKKT